MWSAKQLFPLAANARSRVLAVLSLFGIEFNPKLAVDPNVNFDLDTLYDIPDKYAGLIIVYNYLIQRKDTIPDIASIMVVFKDEIMEFAAGLFQELIKGDSLEGIYLTLGISDRQVIILIYKLIGKEPKKFNMHLRYWEKTTLHISAPTPIEGISYNLALLLENEWNNNNYTYK